MTDIANPLLREFDTPHHTVPFPEIKNSDYLPAIKEAIAEAKAEVNAIVESEEEPTFDNTILALENSGQKLDKVLNVFYPLLSANSDNELMEISLEVSPLLSEYSTSISLNEGLWKRIKHVWDNTNFNDLDTEDRMLLQETYESFSRNGALLEGEDREKLKALRKEISELTTRFGQNVLKELNTYQIWLTAEDLDGLPETLVESAAQAAKNQGREGEYLFTLAQPDYMPFMKFSRRRDLREKMYRLYTGRNMSGEFSNMDIVLRLTELRRQLANLLGYKTYAEFVLERKMAKTPERVYDLLYSLRDAYKPAQAKEFEQLEEFARSLDGDDLVMRPWDYSYYANLLKEKLYDYSEEEMRPYFELSSVIDGVFSLATRLYGITFEPNGDIPVYHKDVKAFDVKDEDGTYLGVLYTDFFPRESKQPGAWMTDFKGQWLEADGKDSRPHVSIVMNFTKPSESKPSLLTPYEVNTFLHEFGHALHGLLSKVRYASLSGTNVRRDFVELPSQFNENFLTERAFLDSFARHYKTGEPIPQEMVDRLIASSRFGAAYACLRQLNFGLLDMAWHSITAPVSDVTEFEHEAGKSVEMFEPVEGSLVSPQFSHIFSGGYAAGYYSYKWAEVLDADAFAAFKEHVVFDRETARRFRNEILSRGGSEEPDVLYRRFRGQEPTIDALLRRDGILPESD